MFQRILTFLLSNPILLIIILGGLFNVSVRIAQKAKEQRAKRDAAIEMARRKQEALRTGRSIAEPTSSAGVPTLGQDAKAQRRERIEALRQERMEQLRALREKRAGTASASSSPGQGIRQGATGQGAGGQGSGSASLSSASQQHPTLPPIPIPAHPQQQRQSSRQRPQQRSQPRRRQIISPSSPAQQPPRLSDPQTQTQPNARDHQPPRPSKARSAGTIETVRGASNAARPQLARPERPQRSGSARSMLRSRSSIRQAVILREILDPPVGLRDQDSASGSLFS